MPLLLAVSLDLFVTVLVPVEAEKAEDAVEAVETIEAVATCEACPETFRDLITQQKKRQKITFNEESRKVVHGSFFTFLFSILYKTTTTQDPNFIVLTKSMINIHLSISIDNMTVRWIDYRIMFQKSILYIM